MKRLYIKVPWSSLSSQPVKVEITGLELVISPLEKDKWLQLVEHQNQFAVLEQHIMAHAMKILKNLIQEKNELENKDAVAKKEDSSSFLLNLTTKIVDNLQICIQNIHIRYEDTMFFQKPICMGITLQKLSI